MLINEVCSMTGLSRKSIRYYEEEGLLNPKRNENNDYRLYDEDDINNLKIIKFLRELNVSINEIKKLKENELSLKECMIDRIKKIENEQKDYEKIKNMCEDIIDKNYKFDDIKITKYSQQMSVLNKKGFTMKDVKTNKKKKIVGAILASVIFSTFFLSIIAILTNVQLNGEDKAPWVIYIFIVLLLLVLVYGIISNLISRIKEIKGGEEDEASKY